MNYIDNITNVIADVTVIVVTVYTVLGYLVPWLRQKKATAKNDRVKSRYDLLDKWAENAVAEMAPIANMIGQDKKQEAVRIVNKQLADHKIPVDAQNVSAAIEKAVQELSVKGGNNANENVSDLSQQVVDHLPDTIDGQEPANSTDPDVTSAETTDTTNATNATDATDATDASK
ncbi:phage holin [Pediococcus ethanolidurans]|uniref:Phage holin, LL-H family n=1 Tax=Pediococcus ethanolidurans TaxID=319653 RepID=A0A0R2K044_9LACO|nr:phage holin [Pediococcus ethanolidurans]KRN82910.1 hypothetical protein IV87_GL001864 [Pediococcus ethanolidurans]GEN94675.1 hypothetical protein PET01_07250 [Pediococcus ethanolidurans]SER17138.1 phage holin, LL-H family [Pediococcus ethanolidurans]